MDFSAERGFIAGELQDARELAAVNGKDPT
jgi:hypothetical protein